MKVIVGIFVIIFLGLTCAQKGCLHGGCVFGEKIYDEGETLSGFCFQFICRGKNWIYAGIDRKKCDKCHVTGDPHFVSFDYLHYDWHGTCNYSLSQAFSCRRARPDSYNPYSAVYADFVQCRISASCLDVTTYKINPYTVVTLDHRTSIPNSLDINGNTFNSLSTTPSSASDCFGNYYPTLIWREGYCANIVGEMYSISACGRDLFIYTSKEFIGTLVGLCGYYSGTTKDEYVPRDSCFNPIFFPDFAISWLTNDQKRDCNKDYDYESYFNTQKIEDACKKEEFHPICEKSVLEGYDVCKAAGIESEREIQTAIEDCERDCCFSPETCEEWSETVKEMATIACNTLQMENGV